MTVRPAASLSRGLLAAFTLPTLMLGIMHGPEGQLQAIYARYAGLGLTALGAVVLLTKIFDGVTYPLIGTLSDRSHAHSGTRRTWVMAGTMVSVLGVWFLLRPPPQVSLLYFGVWMSVTYVGWKLIEIPLQAWSYGLSGDYAQRARVQAWRALAQMAGQLLFFATPWLAVQLGRSDSTELDFRALGVAAVICCVALPLATALMIWRTPEGAAAPPAQAQRFGLRQVIAAVRHNPPLLRLIAAFLPVNLLAGMCNGVALLYMDAYLGLGKQFPAIMALAFLSTLGGIPFWTALSARYERHRVWLASLLVGGLALLGSALLTPGPAALPLCFLLYPTIFFTLAGTVMVYTMSADIVDYGRLHTGEDHAGLYGALFAFLQKSLLGVSTAAGVSLVGISGFDATASAQTPGAVLGIKLAVAIIPAIGILAAAAIIRGYPLSRTRMAKIQTALLQRDREVGIPERQSDA